MSWDSEVSSESVENADIPGLSAAGIYVRAVSRREQSDKNKARKQGKTE